MAKRIQRHRHKGWQMPEDAVYVGRPSRWGNPFVIRWEPMFGRFAVIVPDTGDSEIVLVPSKEEARAVAVEMFALHCGPMGSFEIESSDIEVLRDKDLCCWCPPHHPCHADILLGWANA